MTSSIDSSLLPVLRAYLSALAALAGQFPRIQGLGSCTRGCACVLPTFIIFLSSYPLILNTNKPLDSYRSHV